MGNGKVQPIAETGEVTIRKGRIHKGIQRTLNTAKFESIVINYEIDEEIEWTSLEERDRKVKNWTTVLVKEFQECHDRILEELNLSHKKAYFKNNLEDKDYKTGVSTPELQSLDTLE